MYEYLQGRLVNRGPARVVVDVGGIGYELAVPVGADLGAVGEDVCVWTHLVVREDAHTLYGFPDTRAREWFRVLLGVRGVGPGLALGILSGLPAEAFLQALVDNDPKPLVAIRGVGRKTAEQILLDLRDKAPRLAAGADHSPAELVPQAPRSRVAEDAVSALVSIGYKEKEAERSVAAAAKSVDPNDLEALVRAALQG